MSHPEKPTIQQDRFHSDIKSGYSILKLSKEEFDELIKRFDSLESSINGLKPLIPLMTTMENRIATKEDLEKMFDKKVKPLEEAVDDIQNHFYKLENQYCEIRRNMPNNQTISSTHDRHNRSIFLPFSSSDNSIADTGLDTRIVPIPLI